MALYTVQDWPYIRSPLVSQRLRFVGPISANGFRVWKWGMGAYMLGGRAIGSIRAVDTGHTEVKVHIDFRLQYAIILPALAIIINGVAHTVGDTRSSVIVSALLCSGWIAYSLWIIRRHKVLFFKALKETLGLGDARAVAND